MTLLLDLPVDLERRLRREARNRDRTPEQIALEILEKGLIDNSLLQAVAKVKALSPNARNIIPPQGSLLDALRQGEPDPDFNLQQWESEWAQAEAEMEQVEKLNEFEEGLS